MKKRTDMTAQKMEEIVRVDSTFMQLLMLVSVGLAAVLPDRALAATYYVSSVKGSDSNPGTQAAPFASLQVAADRINPGDTVIVGDGVYTSSNFSVIDFSRGGNAGAWVTFKAQNKWGAKISGNNNQTKTGITFEPGHSGYIRIQDFEMYGFGSPSAGAGAISTSGTHDIDIVGNFVHDIGRQCTNTAYGNVGIYGQSSNNITVQRNIFRDIGRFSPGENGCQPANAYYQNHDHGVYIDGMNGAKVINNTFINIQHGWPIQIYSSTGLSVDSLLVANNTFFGGNPWRDGHIVIAGPLSNSSIANNIFYQPTNSALRFTASVNNLGVTNNVTYPGSISGGTFPAGAAFGGNLDAIDPMMVAPSSFDFHLRSGSPAIDRGISLSSVINDLDGISRPQGAGCDIGAYEYLASAPSSSPTPAPAPAPSPSSTPASVPTFGNLVQNPGFEEGSKHWTDWGNTTIVSRTKRSGTYSLRTGTGAGGRVQVLTTLRPGVGYVLSAAARLSAIGAWCGVEIEFRDASGKVLADSTKYISPSTTSWETYSVAFTAPASFADARVYVWKDSGANHCYVDDTRLVPK